MVPMPTGADANSGMMAAQGGKDMGYETARLWAKVTLSIDCSTRFSPDI
jgi:hypothetical protein